MVAGHTLGFSKKAPPDTGAFSFIYPPTKDNLTYFASLLKEGGLVAIPTETVYGLAAKATDIAACQTVFTIKGRPLIDPLIVHVDGPEMAAKLAEWNDRADCLAKAFWPGPLSIILRKKPCIPDIVTAGLDTVAIRCPRHPDTLSLITEVGTGLAAPSANPFGYISPSRAKHVADSFGERVPYIIDGGSCEIGLESTVLDLSDNTTISVLRPGAISAEAISDVLKEPVLSTTKQIKDLPLSSPGTLLSHYSPTTPLELFSGIPPTASATEAVIFLKAPQNRLGNGQTFWFSESGEAEEIARTLFDLLRKLDRAGFTRIYCEIPAAPAVGLMLAIRDRLTRAAAK